MRYWMAAGAAALALGAAAGNGEPVDQAMIARMKTEGFQHSKVMDTLSWLTDVYGPRLSGSPNLRRAGEWARDEMTKWGLQRAGLEPYPTKFRGWSVNRFTLEMTEPQYMRINGYPFAWAPSTPGTITGTPIVVDIKDKADFEKFHGKLRGAIVMNGRPNRTAIGFEPEAKRYTDAELQKQTMAITPGEPASLEEEEKEFNEGLEKSIEVLKFFAAEGVAAVVKPSAWREVVTVSGNYDQKWQTPFPSFVFSREHYGRIVRMIDRKVAVKLSLSLDAQVTPEAEGFNVVAEIPGTDPALEDQVVMLGGHLDSWHAGTGATDNAAGCAAAMEAVRILQAIGARPRRTIRVALWTGEEQDYFGSMGYVHQHFADAKTLAPRPEHAKLAAYFNVDNGSGRIRGVNLQGNEAARPIFEAWLQPFTYLGATTVTTLNTGGTDHMPFNAVGLPGFQFIQDPLDYETRAHHSSLDVYEEVEPEDLQQVSVVLASFVYHASMRDEMLPRPQAPKPIAVH